MASLRMANLNYHLNKFDDSVKIFDEVIKDFQPKNEEALLFKAMAFEGKGTVLETQQKWDEALSTYRSAAQFEKIRSSRSRCLGKFEFSECLIKLMRLRPSATS